MWFVKSDASAGAALALAVLGGAMSLARPAAGQDLVRDALGSFPRETVRVEYSSPARLRRLPNYASLRKRYVGPRLLELETALAKLGVQADDVDDLILGWKVAEKEMDLYGLAAGRFDPGRVARSAALNQLAPVGFGSHQGYCLASGPSTTCVVILGESRGAFGPRPIIGSLVANLATPSGEVLSGDDRFVKLVSQAPVRMPIWGVAVGPAVVDWFRSWMPEQQSLQFDWSQALRPVESLVYGIEAEDKVRLTATLDCGTAQAAQQMRLFLDGVRLLQQAAWQNRNPNLPNPISNVEVNAQGPQVNLGLALTYRELEVAAPGSR